jgi:uncharacterized membrane protein
MGRLLRILRHRWFDETDSRRALGDAVLARIEQRVKRSETLHHGEIRVCVEAGLPLSYLWQGASARDRAVSLFGKLRVWDTEANNGVLIYVLLAEHAIEIVADRGVTRHVPQEHWQAVVGGMQAAFRRGEFESGLMQAVEAVDAMLVKHFARAEGSSDRNELPDRPLTL